MASSGTVATRTRAGRTRTVSGQSRNNQESVIVDGGTRTSRMAVSVGGVSVKLTTNRRLPAQQSFIGDLSMYSQTNDKREEHNVFYFVLPDGKTEATCSPNLISIFTYSKESADLYCKWISEKECLECNPAAGNVFIMDPFSGPAYDYLISFKDSKKCQIMGPQVLKYLIKEINNPNPTGPLNIASSPFTLGMRNLLINISGSPTRKAGLSRKVQLMAGEVTPQLTRGVTHVVADKVLKEKVVVAYKSNIPVMTTQWVDDVYEDSQNSLIHATDAKYAKHTCKIFHNLAICVSQVPATLKNALRKVIDSNGGTYTADLKKSNDVLIVSKPEGDKYTYAQQWKIVCLSSEWIDACKTAGHVVDWKDFEIGIDKDSRLAGAAGGDTTGGSIDGNVKSSTPLNSMLVPIDAMIGGEHSMLSGICHMPRTKNRANSIDALLKQASELLKKSATMVPYLDGCKIYISKSQKSEEIRKLVNGSGATRLSEISENVTHIIALESGLLDSEVKILKELEVRPQIVTGYWLIESAKQGGSADEFLFKVNIGETGEVESRSQVLNTISSNNGNSFTREMPENGRRGDDSVFAVPNDKNKISIPCENQTVQSKSTSREGFANKYLDFDIDIEIDDDVRGGIRVRNSSAIAADTSKTFVFNGLKFKIFMEDPEEEKNAKLAITEYGGEISGRNDYTIAILAPIYHKDMKFIPGAKLRTKYWLDDCIEKETLCEEHFCYTPLPAFHAMLDVLAGVVVAISQYTLIEKDYIQTLITAMGGLYQDVFARKNNAQASRTTHLICASIGSEKCNAAQKWGTPIAVAEWVVECFKSQQKVSVENFHPAIWLQKSDSEPAIYPCDTPAGDNLGRFRGNLNPALGHNSAVAPISGKNPNKNGTVAVAQTFSPIPSAAGANGGETFKTPINKVPPTRARRERIEPEKFEKTDSFLEYCEAHKDSPLLSPGYYAWKEQQPDPIFSEDEDDGSHWAGKEYGWTRAQARALDREMRLLTPRYRSPVFRPVLGNREALAKMQNEFWAEMAPKLPLKFRVRSPSPPGNSDNDESINPPQEKSIPKQNVKAGQKRGSDSSVEEEAVAATVVDSDASTTANDADEFVLPKRIKRSSDQEKENDININKTRDSTTTNTSTSFHTSTTSSRTTSEKSDNSVEESKRVEETSKTSKSKLDPDKRVRNLKNLAQLLAAGEESKNKRLQERQEMMMQKRRNTRSLNMREGSPIRPEEMDAPEVIWDETHARNSSGTDTTNTNNATNNTTNTSNTTNESDEDDEEDNEESKFEITLPNNPVFIISGVTEDVRQLLMQQITELGGSVSTSTGFDLSSFGIIVDTLAKSEKVLCSIASGKPLIRSVYMTLCIEAGKFLKLNEDHVWNKEVASLENKSQMEQDIADAGFHWLCRIQSTPMDRPFKNEKYFLNVKSNRTTAFSELIRAGGGQVTIRKEDANVIISSQRKSTAPDFDPETGIPIQTIFYLNMKILEYQ